MEYPWCNYTRDCTTTVPDKTADLIRNFDIAFFITSSFGLVFNFLSVVVLLFPSVLSSYSFLLISLSVADSIQLLYYWLFFGLSAFGNANCPFDLGEVWPAFQWALAFALDVAFTASIYIMLMVSLERYTAVSRSLDLNWTGPALRRTALHVLAVVILSGVYNAPKFFELEFCRVRDISGCPQPLDSFRLQHSWFYRNELYRYYYVIGANIVVNWLVPLLILVYLNVSIYFGLQEIHKRRQQLFNLQQRPGRAAEDREFSMTTMLIFIVGFFCLCHIWYPVAQLGSGFGDALFWSKMYTYMYCLNSSINFVIYCVLGKAFRVEMKSVLKELREFASRPQHCKFMVIRFMFRESTTTVNVQGRIAGV